MSIFLHLMWSYLLISNFGVVQDNGMGRSNHIATALVPLKPFFYPGGLSTGKRVIRRRELRTVHASFARGGGANSNESITNNSEFGESTTQKDDTSMSSLEPSYYLVWCSGVWKKIIFGLVVLYSVRLVAAGITTKGWTKCQLHSILNSPPVHAKWFKIIALPLLSSACCGIQLLINAVVAGSGCAGFNKYLGPLRPYFLSFLIFSSAMNFTGGVGEIRWFSTIISSLIALLPEVVHVWNSVRGRSWRRRLPASGKGSEDAVEATVSFRIPSMGCVACINKIDSSLHKAAPAQILEVHSRLSSVDSQEGGVAQVKLSATSENEIKVLSRTLENAVREAGFDTCTLQSIELAPRIRDGTRNHADEPAGFLLEAEKETANP